MLTILFIVALLFALGGVGWAVFGDEMRGAGAATAVVAVLVALLTCFSVVDARSVGIQTSFGKFRDTLSPGLQMTAPWSNVEEWTTRNQTIDFAADDKDDRDNFRDEAAISVRLGNQSVAYVDARVSWAVAESGNDTKAQADRIKKLWQQYKTFDDMARDYAVPAARAAANAAFDGYDPFAALNDKTVDNPYVPLAEWSKKITETLRPLYVDRGLTLISVQVTQVKYDDRTEGKLREYADAVANTRIKAQDVKTAEQEALASKARATQAAPGCEALIRDLAAKDQLKNLPAGWQCPGTNSPPVIVGK